MRKLPSFMLTSPSVAHLINAMPVQTMRTTKGRQISSFHEISKRINESEWLSKNLHRYGDVFLGWLVVSIFPSHVNHVFSLRTEKQMVWIHAVPVVAMMADEVPIRNRPTVQYPRCSVTTNRWAVGVNDEITVARMQLHATPVPASSDRIYSVQCVESFFGRSTRDRRHSTTVTRSTTLRNASAAITQLAA